jgi:nitroreductase
VNNLLDVLKNRRSIRSYKSDPIPENILENVLEAFRWAPSGANAQPWELVVVRDKSKIEAIADIFIELVERQKKLDPDFPGNSRRYLKDVPIIIVVCGDPRFKLAYPQTLSEREKDNIYFFSIGAAIQTLMLAAAEQKLGSVWLTPEKIEEQKLKDMLGIPDVLEVLACIPLGLPKKNISGRVRRSINEFVHFDSFDNSKFRSTEQVNNFIKKSRIKAMYGQVKNEEEKS